MFIGLLDPRWREQQNKTVGEKKQQDEIFAVGMYINTYGVHRLHTSSNVILSTVVLNSKDR